MKERHDCFISYAREDKETAQRLFSELANASVKAWMDKPPAGSFPGILIGENWEEQISKAIASSRYFIAILSKASTSKTGYVQVEFRRALQRMSQMPSGSIYLLPVRVDDCEVPQHTIEGVRFDQIQYIDVREGKFSELIEQLLAHRGGENGELSDPVEVENPGQFFSALKSNSKIEISGKFDISERSSIRKWMNVNRFLRFTQRHDGYQPEIRNATRLSIVSADLGINGIEVSPRYVDVLFFNNCREVLLSTLRLGHTKFDGYCTENVVGAQNCNQLHIDECQLFGCGAYGLQLNHCNDFQMIGGSIYECTYGIMDLRDTSAKFDKCTFRNNREFSGVIMRNCDVEFRGCWFFQNVFDKLQGQLFDIDLESRVSFVNCRFESNRTKSFCPPGSNVKMRNCTFNENSW
ncbi:MAG: TIR domain-containing protein [Pseudomonadota bacterium]